MTGDTTVLGKAEGEIRIIYLIYSNFEVMDFIFKYRTCYQMIVTPVVMTIES